MTNLGLVTEMINQPIRCSKSERSSTELFVLNLNLCILTFTLKYPISILTPALKGRGESYQNKTTDNIISSESRERHISLK